MNTNNANESKGFFARHPIFTVLLIAVLIAWIGGAVLGVLAYALTIFIPVALCIGLAYLIYKFLIDRRVDDNHKQ